MALGQRRMVYTNLWQNEDFARMSKLSRLLYIGLITLADDDGRLKGNTTLLKSQVFPYDSSIKVDDIKKAVKEISNAKLIVFYKEGDGYYIQHPNWIKYQSIRKDLYKPSKIPAKTSRKRNGKDTESHPNISKDNIREERAYLSNIPKEDLDEFVKRFDASELAIKSKAEDLKLWCEMNGKIKRNHKSFLLNALKKDFPERRKPIVISQVVVNENGPRTPIPKDIKDGINKIINNIKQT